jgi:hypothetical protein
LVSLPDPKPIREIDGINLNTLNLSDMDRADLVASMIDVAKANHVDASGSFSNELSSIAVANSKGFMAIMPAITCESVALWPMVTNRIFRSDGNRCS